jgi:cellobiose phosphorylase
MKYGYFSKDSREYIITDPKTPTPWMNYISNRTGYCGIVSQTGGGFSFYKDPRDRRITRYRYNNIPYDRPGRYFYLKNEETGEYWSPAWQPVMKNPEFYRCHHGQGYTIIHSGYNKIAHTVCYFVPPEKSCEIWQLEIHNTGGKPVVLSIYSYCEFTLWSEPQSRNIQWSLHLTKCFFKSNKIIYPFIEPHPAFDVHENKGYNPEREGLAFMGMSLPVNDFDCSRDSFIGLYQSETNPRGVEQKALSCSILEGGIPCAALRSHMELKTGEKAGLTVILGFAAAIEEADVLHRYFSDAAVVKKEFEQVRENWNKYCEQFSVLCPDKDVASVVSIWNPYQCKTTFDWSRYISFYENGEGRGMGVRDSCQDALAVCAHAGEEAGKRIKDIISICQFENGSCYHQYFPLDKKGDLKGFSDDHLWLIVMVYFYIAETGDVSILKEKLPFAGSRKQGSLYEHLLASIHYTKKQRGVHGLPLILVADWNDTLHLWMASEKPESVFVAELFSFSCTLLAELALIAGENKDSSSLLSYATEMAALINNKCWDGEWYLRGFGRKKIGTIENTYAKIFLNTQTWAVISGVARGERAITCMDSVRRYLYTREGIKLLFPPFERYDNDHGLISRYVKGRKENGIFAHAHSWAIIAECLLGRNNYAYEYYSTILPVKRNDQADILKTEPYVYCQTISSNDSLFPGEGANSWLTGTASWMYIAFTQYILGIKPTLKGLEIRPCIPEEWDGFKVVRLFRGCRYHINCMRTGDFQVKVNGTLKNYNRASTLLKSSGVKGAVIPPQEGTECRIDVEI